MSSVEIEKLELQAKRQQTQCQKLYADYELKELEYKNTLKTIHKLKSQNSEVMAQ